MLLINFIRMLIFLYDDLEEKYVADMPPFYVPQVAEDISDTDVFLWKVLLCHDTLYFS